MKCLHHSRETNIDTDQELSIVAQKHLDVNSPTFIIIIIIIIIIVVISVIIVVVVVVVVVVLVLVLVLVTLIILIIIIIIIILKDGLYGNPTICRSSSSRKPTKALLIRRYKSSCVRCPTS